MTDNIFRIPKPVRLFLEEADPDQIITALFYSCSPKKILLLIKGLKDMGYKAHAKLWAKKEKEGRKNNFGYPTPKNWKPENVDKILGRR